MNKSARNDTAPNVDRAAASSVDESDPFYGTAAGRSETQIDVSGVEDEDRRKSRPVSWMSLPNKTQLSVLIMARLSEPLVQTSLQSYMFYQLKSFDQSLPDSVIAGQAGVLQASFKGGQLLTAMTWGTVADSDWAGRKFVIMTGLLGTFVSCLGFGFAQTFWQALMFRIIGGALNGNVAVMRTVISELIVEKKYQPKAFLLMPMCFNVGSIIGPLMGGLLADPAASYPDLFGDVEWLIKYPYAAPNLVSAAFMLWSAGLVFFGLEETLESLRHKEGLGSRCARNISTLSKSLTKRFISDSKDKSPAHADESTSLLPSPPNELVISNNAKPPKRVPKYTQKLPFRRVFTSNVINTISASAVVGIYLGSFNSLWPIYLSTSVSSAPQHPPFLISGGLGMPPRDVGFAMALVGFLGLALQLFVYPPLTHRIGVLRAWRVALYAFPLAAVAAPLLPLVPSSHPYPAGKEGVLIWLAVAGVLSVQVVGKVFVGPANATLINNCAPHPSRLATVHSIAQTVASAVRTVAPIVAGWLYGAALGKGAVGVVWWGLAGVALYGCFASTWVREGDGHEIRLEGDAEEE